MKRLLVLFLALFILFSLYSCGSNDSTTENITNIETTVKNDASEEIDIENDEVESVPEDFVGIDTPEGFFIDEYKGTAKKVIVPDEIDGKTVVGIEIDAFNNVEIEEIVMPSGLEKIQKSTFYDNFFETFVRIFLKTLIFQYFFHFFIFIKFYIFYFFNF